MCEIHSRRFTAVTGPTFLNGLHSVPVNSFVRDFFSDKLRPFCGQQTTIRVLNNVLEISWRMFVLKNPHYYNSADEFKLGLFAYELIEDKSLAAEFVVYLLRRQMETRQAPEKRAEYIKLEEMYKEAVEPFNS